MKATILIVFLILLLSLFYFFFHLDIKFLLRQKTAWELNTQGCILGVSIKDNSIQHRFPLTNIYYLFEDKFPFEIVNKAHENEIVMITWEPFDKMNQQNNILPAIATGKYDLHIRNFARDAKISQKQIILRFAHEMNGNWYPWSGHRNNFSPNNFINSFRRIHTIFKEELITNVRFAFAVNWEDVPNEAWNKFENYYPGDEFVDLIVFDIYNTRNQRKSPKKLLSHIYERLIDSFPEKPIMIGEIGTSSNKVDKLKWINELFTLIKRRFTAVKGVVWFDINKEDDWGFSHDSKLDSFFLSLKSDQYYNINNLSWIFTDEKK